MVPFDGSNLDNANAEMTQKSTQGSQKSRTEIQAISP
jgi:hypothetical protein